jgi:hypothetical protein
MGEFKVFAEVPNGLFQHRFGAAFAALVRHVRVVMRAVQAHAQIGAAFHAGFPPARLAGNGPGLAAVVAVSSHGDSLRGIHWPQKRFLGQNETGGRGAISSIAAANSPLKSRRRREESLAFYLKTRAICDSSPLLLQRKRSFLTAGGSPAR